MDPRTRLGLLATASVLAVTLDHPGSLLLLTAICVLPIAALRPPLRWWLRGAAVVLGLVWSTVLSQGLFYDDQPRVALVTVGPLTRISYLACHGGFQTIAGKVLRKRHKISRLPPGPREAEIKQIKAQAK